MTVLLLENALLHEIFKMLSVQDQKFVFMTCKRFRQALRPCIFEQLLEWKRQAYQSNVPQKLTFITSEEKVSFTTFYNGSKILCCHHQFVNSIEDRAFEIVMQTCQMVVVNDQVLNKRNYNQVHQGFYPQIQVCKNLRSVHEWLIKVGFDFRISIIQCHLRSMQNFMIDANESSL